MVLRGVAHGGLGGAGSVVGLNGLGGFSSLNDSLILCKSRYRSDSQHHVASLAREVTVS